MVCGRKFITDMLEDSNIVVSCLTSCLFLFNRTLLKDLMILHRNAPYLDIKHKSTFTKMSKPPKFRWQEAHTSNMLFKAHRATSTKISLILIPSLIDSYHYKEHTPQQGHLHRQNARLEPGLRNTNEVKSLVKI